MHQSTSEYSNNLLVSLTTPMLSHNYHVTLDKTAGPVLLASGDPARVKVPSPRRLYVAVIASLVVGLGALFILFIFPMVWPEGAETTDNDVQSVMKVAVVTDADFSDKGWGESSLKAAKIIERKHNITITTEDNVAIPDIETTLERYAEFEYDLIIAHGFQWGEPALQVGSKHPQTKIVVFTGLVKSSNVASIFPQQQEGSFLLGALAGMMTESDIIGFVGGEEYPNVINIFEGYKQGAKFVNSNITVIGTYLNDWDNAPRGKEAASSIIRRGADLVFHVADSSGQGVIQAAAEHGVYALGAVQDQNHIGPDTVLSSFVIDVDKAYDSAVAMVRNKTFEGEIFRPGLERQGGTIDSEGIVYLAPFHGLEDQVPATVRERLTNLTNDILAGQIRVPERLEATPSES